MTAKHTVKLTANFERNLEELEAFLVEAGAPHAFDALLDELVALTEGFSGAEIEQGVVSALYAAHGEGGALDQRHLIDELRHTRPLSVVMAEKVNHLRAWAAERTVPAD